MPYKVVVHHPKQPEQKEALQAAAARFRAEKTLKHLDFLSLPPRLILGLLPEKAPGLCNPEQDSK
jgi:hypothetical protein